MKTIAQIRIFATEAHAKVQQLYDVYPYSFHLDLVAYYVRKTYRDYTPTEQYYLLGGAYCHDLIEDAQLTYNDLVKEVGEDIADIAYRCTSEKGRNRNERQNEKFYTELRENPLAIHVKICDRIANMTYSKSVKSSMFNKYCKEIPHFTEKLFIDYPQHKMAQTLLSSLI